MDVEVYQGLPEILYAKTPALDMAGNAFLGQNSSGMTCPFFYNYWRVIGFGFTVVEHVGISTQDPKIEFGVTTGDLSTVDNDYFGSITQDTTAGKHFEIGDMFLHDPLKFYKKPLPLENGGTPTVVTSSHFMEWQSLATGLKAFRLNDHQLGVFPMICIEIRR